MLFLFQKQNKNVSLQLFYIFENIKVIKGDSFEVIIQQTIEEINSAWLLSKTYQKILWFSEFFE